MTVTAVDERLLLDEDDMLVFSALHAACSDVPSFNEALPKADQIAAISAATAPLAAELLAARKEIAGLREGLGWYAEQTRLCRLIHSEGDAGRNALAKDGGQRARNLIAGGNSNE